jgi:hypothetical protein
MVKVPLRIGMQEGEENVVAIGVSTCVYVEGLTTRILVSLLSQLALSARKVSDVLGEHE